MSATLDSITTNNPGYTPPTSSSPGSFTPSWHMTQGWWMTVGCTVSILLGGTPAAPFCLGLLSIALLYEVGQLLQKK